jgi:RimJ/RimL family protein N-acetyltransferase
METERLKLRRFTPDDAPFTYDLVNDPAWIANIGDRGVRNLEDARRYIGKMTAMYDRYGFGMYLVELRDSGRPIGTCGLVKRDGLDHADIGFAFLPQFRSQGFAREAAAAVMKHARDDLGLDRILAIVTPANKPSVSLIEKIGLRFDRFARMPGGSEDLAVYTT